MYIRVAIWVGIDMPSATRIIKFLATFLFISFCKLSLRMSWPKLSQNSRVFSSARHWEWFNSGRTEHGPWDVGTDDSVGTCVGRLGTEIESSILLEAFLELSRSENDNWILLQELTRCCWNWSNQQDYDENFLKHVEVITAGLALTRLCNLVSQSFDYYHRYIFNVTQDKIKYDVAINNCFISFAFL